MTAQIIRMAFLLSTSFVRDKEWLLNLMRGIASGLVTAIEVIESEIKHCSLMAILADVVG
jgi:hypothetical protein